MEAFIDITGQPKGNWILKNKIQKNSEEICDVRDCGFNNYRIIFNSVEAAKTAIKKSYEDLIADEPDCNNIELLYNSESVRYDASIAIMFKINE